MNTLSADLTAGPGAITTPQGQGDAQKISNPAREAAHASATSGATVTATSDSVHLSSKGQAAQALLGGSAAGSSQPVNPAIVGIAKSVAAGIYRPPPDAIARALVRFETQLLNNKG